LILSILYHKGSLLNSFMEQKEASTDKKVLDFL